jgi:hypothetical protein
MGEGRDTLDTYKQEIDRILIRGEAKPINKCYATYEVVERADAELRGKLLEYVGELFELVESTSETRLDEKILDAERDLLRDKYSRLVDTMFEMELAENPAETEFYEWMWGMINNPAFPDEKARVFAMYWVMVDGRIPYFHLEQGLRMADEDWRATGKALERERNKVRFILYSSFEQRSEQADLVLKELDALVRLEDRVRLMGYAIYLLSRQGTANAVDEMLETTAEG